MVILLIFLKNYASGENMKLASIVADMQDPKLMSLVASLSLFNLTISGPYLNVMNNNLPYGSFPIYVKTMH